MLLMRAIGSAEGSAAYMAGARDQVVGEALDQSEGQNPDLEASMEVDPSFESDVDLGKDLSLGEGLDESNSEQNLEADDFGLDDDTPVQDERDSLSRDAQTDAVGDTNGLDEVDLDAPTEPQGLDQVGDELPDEAPTRAPSEIHSSVQAAADYYTSADAKVEANFEAALSVDDKTSNKVRAQEVQTCNVISPSYGLQIKWLGSLAKTLDLPDEVTREDLAKFLKGQGLDGQPLSEMVVGQRTHRPGIEILMSADKSVSLASLLPGGDPRIGAARALAAEETFDLVEKEFGFARVTQDGVTEHKGNMQLLGCRVRELTSRDGDPHEHVHMLVFNIARDPGTGKYRALDNSELYSAQSLIERGFHEAEGRLIEGLGYQIDRAHSDGLPTFGAIESEARDAFSSRHRAIQAKADARQDHTRAGLEKAWDQTRKGKEPVLSAAGFAATRESWGQTAKDQGLDIAKVLDDAKAQNRDKGRISDRGSDKGSERAGEKNPDKSLASVLMDKSVRNLGPWVREIVTKLASSLKPLLEPLGLTYRPQIAKELIKGEGVGAATADDKSQNSDRYKIVAGKAVALSIGHLEDRSTILSRNQIRDLAMRAADHAIPLASICEAVAREEKSGRLELRPDGERAIKGLTRNSPTPGHVKLRTDRSMVIERALIDTLKAGKGAGKGTGAALGEVDIRAKLDERLGTIALNSDQKRVVIELVAPKDKIQAIRGLPGVGKTLTLGVARQIIEGQGGKLLALAPTRNATAELATKAGFEAKTTAWFTTKFARLAGGSGEAGRDGVLAPAISGRATPKEIREWGGRTLIIDEASLLSNKAAIAVLNIATKLKMASITFVGDDRQHSAIEAGSPFALMRQAGVAEVQVGQIMRQLDPADRTAIRDLHKGDAAKAFDSFQDRGMVSEVPREDMASVAAQRYLARLPQEREQTGIIAATHVMRGQITGHIRAGLVQEDSLGKETLTLQTWVRTGKLAGEIDLAFDYQKGQALIFGLAAPKHNIKADDQLVITSTNATNRVLTLTRPNGTSLKLTPQDRQAMGQRFEVMEQRSLELAAGDKVQLQRTDKALGLNAGALGTVLGHDAKTLTIDFGQKEPRTLKHTEPGLKFLDHGYVRTTYRFQGGSEKSTILVLDSKGLSATEAATLVGISRHTDTMAIITNDMAGLRSSLAINTGRQPTAHTDGELAKERGLLSKEDPDMGAQGSSHTGRGLGRGLGFGFVADGRSASSEMSQSFACPLSGLERAHAAWQASPERLQHFEMIGQGGFGLQAHAVKGAGKDAGLGRASDIDPITKWSSAQRDQSKEKEMDLGMDIERTRAKSRDFGIEM
jgi:conjugative relaxase-like TrwC/TraI family protein